MRVSQQQSVHFIPATLFIFALGMRTEEQEEISPRFESGNSCPPSYRLFEKEAAFKEAKSFVQTQAEEGVFLLSFIYVV